MTDPPEEGSSQDEVYLAREADAFFARNLADLDPRELRPGKRRIAEWIAEAGVRPRRVLELGCGYGDLLGHYAAAGAELCHGVEPSGRAVARGREVHGAAVHLHRGTIARNPVSTDPRLRGAFDLVIVEDVLCWVARETLFRSIAHIDEALAEGGFLFLREFLPLADRRNRNHHVSESEVWCYKPAGPHARMFTASGMYAIVAGRIFLDRHDPWVRRAGADPFESRWCDVLLRKSSSDYYG